MRRIIEASTRPGDVVWEPFGGLASATVAAMDLGRRAYVSEVVPEFAAIAADRIQEEFVKSPLWSSSELVVDVGDHPGRGNLLRASNL